MSFDKALRENLADFHGNACRRPREIRGQFRDLRSKPLTEHRRKLIIFGGLIGAALFYGDAVLTPAISVLSAVGLLPAALMGLDVVKLLEGAVAMNEHFRTAPPQENIVLQFVGSLAQK